MGSQLLEQILESTETCQRIDLYIVGATALYTGPIKPFKIKPIDLYLDGGLRINENTTPNTVILREDLDQIANTYIHHDRGPGRMETKILKYLKYLKEE